MTLLPMPVPGAVYYGPPAPASTSRVLETYLETQERLLRTVKIAAHPDATAAPAPVYYGPPAPAVAADPQTPARAVSFGLVALACVAVYLVGR